MYIDLIVLIILILIVVMFFKRFSSFVFFMAIIDILLRILSFINNKNIDKEATILPKISLLIEILSFNTLLVPYSNKKSKKKFSKNTKSK